MTRLVVVAAASVGLILLIAFIVARLVRSRSRGLSVRMQVFLALASIVGAFAFGLGLMVLDRVEARAVRLALAAAHDESRAVAAIFQSELARSGRSLPDTARDLERWLPGASTSAIDTIGVELLDPSSRLLFPAGGESRAQEPGAVFVDTPLVVEGRAVGTVRVVKPTIVVQALLADFAPTVLVISLLLGAVAAVAAAWIGSTIAAPIEALSGYAERVAAGERSALPQRVAGREVARLVGALDAMQRQLEGRPFVETFAADLSHELKNPVAAIRASAEVLEDGALDEPEQARRFVARIREAADRIERLLAELLALASVETAGPATRERVELGPLLERELEALPVGRERVTLSVVGRPRVRGDATWLGRAAANLLDNALLHSEPGSAVRVSLSTSPREVTLRVTSAGRIAPHVRSVLFRRFVTTRGDKGGTGLGLAIVRAVAEAHGGRVVLSAEGPPEVTFELSLPAG
jgi:signal transduction histidine kinase